MRDYQHAKELSEEEWKVYDEALKREEPKGLPEKKIKIANILQELKKTEASLVSAGAKTFSELHPEILDNNSDDYDYTYKPAPPVAHETKFSFAVPDLTDEKRIAYLKVFQAAWDGDLEIIKSFTLAPYESEGGNTINPPLKIAVQDGNGFSPFSIAILRGHRDVALKIVEICMTQYRKEDTGLRKFNMRSYNCDHEDEDEDEDDSEYESEEELDLPIISSLVKDKYTVDNLGEVASTVNSDILPLTMIEWPCYPQRILETQEILKSLSHPIANPSFYLYYKAKS